MILMDPAGGSTGTMGPYDQIDTPSLIVDLDVVERNVFEMARLCGRLAWPCART